MKMNKNTYIKVSGILFVVVFVLHLARVVENWSLEVQSYNIPVTVSVLAFLLTGYLGWAAFRLRK